MLAELLPELVRHLVEAGQISRAVDLFANPQWVERRAEQAGLEPVLGDERMVMSAALRDRLDSQVVRLLILSNSIRERFRRAWDDGSAARRIARAGSVEEARSVARSLGDEAVPWADFLAAARAVQLGASVVARQILDGVSVRPWPHYTYRARTFGLPAYEGPEGSVWVYFFCQVFSAAPDTVAHLTQRLCAMSGTDGIPSRYTVWAALLDRLVAEKHAPTLMMSAIELAREVILPGAVPFGYKEIYGSRLKAIEAIAGHVSPTWLGQQLAITLETLQQWNFKGPDDDTTYRAITPLVEHFVILNPLLRDPTLASIVQRAKTVLEKTLFVPPNPTAHSYGDRSYLWARYARSLEGLNSQKAPDAAASALMACEIDAGCNDPPLGWVSRALALLESSKVESVAHDAKSIRHRLGLPLPNDKEELWSPRDDSNNPFQAGLFELAKEQSDRPPEERHSVRPNAAVIDAVRLAILGAWLRAPADNALARFREQAGRLSHDYQNTYKMSWSSVVLQHATALREQGMDQKALATLTHGLDVCLREEDKKEGLLHIIAMLALYDRDAAWAALDRLDLKNPIDIGSAVGVVILKLLKEGIADVDWWVDHLPTHRGKLCSDEHFLLVYGGAYPTLTRQLKLIANRTLNQFEKVVNEVCHDAEGSEETDKGRERLDHAATLAATYASFAYGDTEGEARFSSLLNTLEELDDQTILHVDVIGALLNAFAKSKIRSPIGAEIYLRWLRKQVMDTSIAGRFFNAERLVEAAVALYEASPAEARGLVVKAFEYASEEPAKLEEEQKMMTQIASVLVDFFSEGATNESARQSESMRFADAVVSWANIAGDQDAARQLEEIAASSHEEEAKSRLLAGAAKAYFVTGCVVEGTRCLLMIPEPVLDRMEVIESLYGKRISSAQRRDVVAALLVGGLRAREPLAAALGFIFQYSVDVAGATGAAAYLRSIEESLDDILLSLGIPTEVPGT